MTTHHTVTIRRAIDPRVQQIRVHQILRIRDRIRPRPHLTIGKLPGRKRARSDRPVAGRGRIRFAQPRLIKPTRIRTRARITPRLTTITIGGRVPPTGIAAATRGIPRPVCPGRGATVAVRGRWRSGRIVSVAALHPSAELSGQGVDHVEHALGGGLALGVGLRLDRLDVGPARREALSHEGDASARLRLGDRHDPIIPHRRSLLINEVGGDRLGLTQS